MNKYIVFGVALLIVYVNATSEPICPQTECASIGEGGSFLSEDGCNTCICSGGKALCTKIACHFGNAFLRGNEGWCEGTVAWRRDCQLCVCTPDGRPSCSDYDCKKKIECVADKGLWLNDCNNCFCVGGGEACTRMACPFPVEDVCSGTPAWIRGCSICMCDNGKPYCESSDYYPSDNEI